MIQRGGFRQGGKKQAGGGNFRNAPNQNPKMKAQLLRCPGCPFSTPTMQKLEAHFQRTNHNQAGNGRPTDTMVTSLAPPQSRPIEPAPGAVQGKIPEHVRRSIFALKDYMHRSDREPIIGTEHVLEYRLKSGPNKIETRYFCHICQLEGDLIFMAEHLGSFRHRKLHMAKECPYVLRAPSSRKEDRAQFMRRLAMEIEQEEGMKMYKIDPVIRMAPMISAQSTEAKASNRTSRWDSDGDRQRRMKKSLEYLGTFEIDNDNEANTVTRLTEKLTVELKYYSDKLKEEALFPAKVARAKDIAMSITQSAPRGGPPPQNPGPKNPTPSAPPVINKAQPENLNLRRNPGVAGGPPQPNVEKPYWNPNPGFPQRQQEPPINQRQNFPVSAPPASAPQGHNAMSNVEPAVEQADENMKFLKKLTTLLAALPQRTTPTAESKMNSKLQVLKSLLQNKTTNMDNTPANQQMMQSAPMFQGMENVSQQMNQPLNMMASRNMGPMGQFNQNVPMPMAPMGNNAFPMENPSATQNSLMRIAALLQTSQVNMNSFMSENQNLQNQEFMQNDNSGMLMDQAPFQQPYRDVDFESGSYNRGWDGNTSRNQDFDNYKDEQAPYTRVSLPPSDRRMEMFQDERYRELRREIQSRESRPNYGGRSSRPFDDPGWAERESDIQYGKRAKLESDRMDPSRDPHDDFGSLGINTASLSAELLKRIRGKDMFTVSAILNEYADSYSSK